MVIFKVISYILASVWFDIILRQFVLADYKLWLDNKSFNHSKRIREKAMWLIPAIILLLWPKLYSHQTIWQWHSLLVLIVVILLISFIWWELFDGLYNRKRHFSWRFNGSHDSGDANSDRLLYNLSPIAQLILKFGLILTALLGYIFL